ncbi:MAG: GAF domain-containing protein [Ardenticatenaceae bacterium]|nr:GAF domain-containing protein [Ardenticatenaceae bacterium]
MSSDCRELLRFVQLQNIQLKADNEALMREVEMLHDVLDALRALQEVAASVSEQTNVMGLLDRILASALASINAGAGSLLLVDEETDELVFVVVFGDVREKLTGHRMALGEGIAGWVAANREAVIVDDAHFDPRFSPAVDQDFSFRTYSMVSVPIVYADNVLGVIQALNKLDGETFSEGDLALLGVVAQLAAAAITNMSKVVTAVPPTQLD